MIKSGTFLYTLFGLQVSSEIECPELLPGSAEAEVVIKFAPVPVTLKNPRFKGVRFQAAPGKMLLWVDNIVRILIQDGSTILIDPSPEADEDSIRVFLLGSAFGALLHQRGILPFHGNAIHTPQGAFIFSGNSGAGKSTVAAALLKKGHPLIADDICALRINENNLPEVLPGFPRLKLWEDSLQQLQEEPDNFSRVRPQLKKYNYPVIQAFTNKPVPLASIFILATTNKNEFTFRTVNGIEKFNLVKTNTYRQMYMEGLDTLKQHFKLASIVGNKVPMHMVTRPSEGFQLDSLVSQIEDKYLLNN